MHTHTPKHTHTNTHSLHKLPLIIKMSSSSEYVSLNTNAMDFVNKSLSSEISYPMTILFSVYLKENSSQNRFKLCYSIALVSSTTMNKSLPKKTPKEAVMSILKWLLIANCRSAALNGEKWWENMGQ